MEKQQIEMCVKWTRNVCLDTQLSQAELRLLNYDVAGVGGVVSKCHLALVKGAGQIKVI